MTAEEYAKNLETNLQALLGRAKSGDNYRAPAVRRVYIPKGDGKKLRPIGIPTFEDKVLQRAVAQGGREEEECVYHPETETPQGGVISRCSRISMWCRKYRRSTSA